MKKICVFVAALILACPTFRQAQDTAWAGIAALYTSEGAPQTRDPSRPVQYRVDEGTLGDLTREMVIQRLEAAFDVWRGVETSCLQIEPLGLLGEDVTWQSYETYRIQDVIVIDQDGSVIKNLFGSPTALSGYTSWYFNQGRLEAACIILNGKATGYREDIIIHEIGHALGLGHYDTPSTPIPGPIMSYNPQRATKPTSDDRLTLSWFYPTDAVVQTWGRLTGRVVDWAGQPVPGGIVLAQRVDDPTLVVSSLSSGAGKKDGSFVFPGLPPGDYTIRLEPIPSYYDHGYGPRTYASEYVADDPRDYEIPAEFHSGPAESASWISDPTPSLANVTITAGSETTATLIRNLSLSRWEDATKVTDLDFSSPLNRSFPRLGRIRGQTFVPRGSQISEVTLFFQGNTQGVAGRLFLWHTNAEGQPDPSQPVFATESIPFEGPRLGVRLDPPIEISPGQEYYLGADAPDSLNLYIREDDYPHGSLAWGQSLEKTSQTWDTRFVIHFVPQEVPVPSLPPTGTGMIRLILPGGETGATQEAGGTAWAFDAFPTKGIQLLQPFIASGNRLTRLGVMIATEKAVSGPIHLAIAGPIPDSTRPLHAPAIESLPVLASTETPPPEKIDPQYLTWELNPAPETKVGQTYGLLLSCESGTGRYLLRLREILGDSLLPLVVLQRNEKEAPGDREDRTRVLEGFVLESFFDWTGQQSRSSVNEIYVGG